MTGSFQPPSVAISSLSIRDFRGIQSLDLDFRGPDGNPNSLVVLGGPNGCGKTAVLEAGLLLVGGSELLVGPFDKNAIRKGAADFAIQAAIAHPGGGFTNRHESTRPLSAIPMPVSHWYFSSWRAPQLIGPVDVTVGRRGRRPARTDENRLLNIKQRLVNAATVEKFEQPRLFPGLGLYNQLIQSISDAWAEFYPDAGQRFEVKVIEPDDEGPSGSFDVYLLMQGSQPLEVDLLSAGQLELFLFLSELALNEDREGIIFIDELELHLDRQWHRLILRALRRLQPRVQIVVATHSPEIFDAAASYERHFLVPEDDPRSWLWAREATANSGV